MRLTDPAVQYWSCVAAALATLAVLMLWNRVRGPLIVKGLSRFGLLLGGYAATAVAVLVSVNIAYGGLVVSLDDLFADINPPMHYTHHKRCAAGAEAGAAAGAGGGRPCPQSSAAGARAVTDTRTTTRTQIQTHTQPQPQALSKSEPEVRR